MRYSLLESLKPQPHHVLLFFMLAPFLGSVLPVDGLLRIAGSALRRPAELLPRPSFAKARTATAFRAQLHEQALRESEANAAAPAGRTGLFGAVLAKDAKTGVWTLDVGRFNGVRIGDYATSGEQVMGRVVEVEERTCSLSLLESPGQRTPIVIEDVTREPLHAVSIGRRQRDGTLRAYVEYARRRDLKAGATIRLSRGPDNFAAHIDDAKRDEGRQQGRAVGLIAGTVEIRQRLTREYFIRRQIDLNTVVGVHVLVARVLSREAWVTKQISARVTDASDAWPTKTALGLDRGSLASLESGAPVLWRGQLIGFVHPPGLFRARFRALADRGLSIVVLALSDDERSVSVHRIEALGERAGRLRFRAEPKLTGSGRLFLGPGTHLAQRGVFLGAYRVDTDGDVSWAAPTIELRKSVRVRVRGGV